MILFFFSLLLLPPPPDSSDVPNRKGPSSGFLYLSFFLSFFACSPTSFPFALVVISFLLSLALP